MSTHKCPTPECMVQVKHSQLACRKHWYTLPPDIRSRVWSAYRADDMERHAEAVKDAIAFLQAKAPRIVTEAEIAMAREWAYEVKQWDSDGTENVFSDNGFGHNMGTYAEIFDQYQSDILTWHANRS